jgi:integrase
MLLKQEIGWLNEVVRAKKPRKLPVASTQEEAKAVLKSLSGISWLMASLLYSSRLRLMECIRCRVKDLTLPLITSWSGTARGAKSG